MDPYRTRSVPAINLANSSRLDSLVRAGNLYLTAQDVVALAIENNIDVEVQRYAPLLAREVLKRAQGGGVLRAVGLGVAPGPQSVSLQGVSLTGGSAGSAGSGVSSGGGILTQLGPSIPTLDPTISAFANFQHTTSPQSNTVLTGTNALVADTRTYQAAYSQNWLFGLGATMSYSSQYTKVNSNFYSLNPYTSGNLDLQLTQNLLQGFGSAVNGRNIRVQKNNLKVTDLQFKLQLITTISAVLNLYWDLVSFQQDVQAREQAVKTAQQLYDDNKRMVEVGTLAEIEVTRAESQLYAARQDLVISRTNLLQQETVLKNALSRSGVASADLAAVHIIALDRIAPPDTTEVGELEKLVAEAAEKRPEIQQSRINLESNNLNLVGIKNSLKPTLQAFAELTNNGLTGDLTALGLAAGAAGSPLVGGYGNLLGQIARAEGDSATKAVVFTEFVPTQEMLLQVLDGAGISAVAINGSMSIAERRDTQEEFRTNARVLVSTDAGGEGVNLQFAHVVINYDLPWSPTRIEQRIGRVDRIGQSHDVVAHNLAMESSIDARVLDVLQTKLAVILAELGVDKTTDVLASVETRVDDLYTTAILEPESLQRAADTMAEGARAEVEETESLRDALGPSIVGGRSQRPSSLRRWLDIADDARRRLRDAGRRVDGTVPQVVAGEPVPVLEGTTSGWWTMWEVRTGSEHTATALFVTDSGAVRPDLADRTWTALTECPELGGSRQLTSEEFERLRALAADHTYRDPHGAVPALTLRLAARVQA